MAELRPGWTRWYCRRCARPLINDPSAKPNHADSVSPTGGVAGAMKWKHDQCGGAVVSSMRDVRV